MRMTDPAPASATASGRLFVQAVLKTDVGRVRSENQDSAVVTTPAEEAASGTGGRLLIVADGMGGHRGGATASRLAVESVKQHFMTNGTGDVAETLRGALARANARVYTEAQSNADLRGMGTTVSALLIRGPQAWLAHVGDSRIYGVRSDAIKQFSDDHSLVATMVREGLLTSQEAENHPRRNVLQRSIGVGEEVEIDVRGPIDIREGDVFIVCSDGLHGVVKDDEIRQAAKLPPQQAADRLVNLALERGAPDNVTVIVARIVRGSLEEEETITDGDRALFEETVKEHPAAGMTTPASRSSR